MATTPKKRKPTAKQLDTLCIKECEMCDQLEAQEKQDNRTGRDNWSSKTMSLRNRLEKVQDKIHAHRETINNDSEFDELLGDWIHAWGSHNG